MAAMPLDVFSLSDQIFVNAIEQCFKHLGRTVLVGLCGSQGSGKSTTAERLVAALRAMGRMAVVLSLDDFYLSREERRALARLVHPLFSTRGVPGTHDVELLMHTIRELRAALPNVVTTHPSFDKLTDDRENVSHWHRTTGRPDIVILEGWCVGAAPQPADSLREPINELEQTLDRKAIWRTYVNDRLNEDYARLFAELDLRLMLRAPSFDVVHQWRLCQERGMKRLRPAIRIMGQGEIRRFISHYERLTRWLIFSQPAHLIADLDQQRRPVALRFPTFEVYNGHQSCSR